MSMPSEGRVDTDQPQQDQQGQHSPVGQPLLLTRVEVPHSCLHPLEASIILPADISWDRQFELLRLSDVQQGAHLLYQVVRVPNEEILYRH